MLYIVCLLALLLLQHKLLETELDVVFLCLYFLFSFELVVGLLAVLQVVTEAHLLALLLPLLLEQLLLCYLNKHFSNPDFFFWQTLKILFLFFGSITVFTLNIVLMVYMLFGRLPQ